MNKTAIKLANTAHQRETRDLEKAGLNRILGYSKGSGGAAVPPIQQMFDSNTALNAATAFKTFKEGQWIDTKTRAEVAKTEQDTLTGQADTNLKATLARTNLAQRNLLRMQTIKYWQEYQNLAVQQETLKHQVSSASSKAKMDKIRAAEYAVRMKIVKGTGISLEVFDRIIAGTSALWIVTGKLLT